MHVDPEAVHLDPDLDYLNVHHRGWPQQVLCEWSSHAGPRKSQARWESLGGQSSAGEGCASVESGGRAGVGLEGREVVPPRSFLSPLNGPRDGVRVLLWLVVLQWSLEGGQEMAWRGQRTSPLRFP